MSPVKAATNNTEVTAKTIIRVSRGNGVSIITGRIQKLNKIK